MATTKKAQEWLNNEKADKSATKIEIDKDTELEGELLIENYSDLQTINLSGGKSLTKVTIKNCSKVEVLKLFNNKITEIVGYDQLPNLKEFNFAQNQITGVMDISKNPNIEILVAYGDQGVEVKGWKSLKNIRHVNLGFIGKDISQKIKFSPFDDRKEELTEMAKDSGIGDEKTKDKSPEEIKQLIKDESDKNNQNKTKLDKELPGLLDPTTGKVDDNKLNDIKKGAEKVKPLEEILQAAGIDPDSKNAKEEAENLKKTNESLNQLGIDKNKVGETISKYIEAIENNLGSEYLAQIQTELKQ